jgi:hypothetical protein
MGHFSALVANAMHANCSVQDLVIEWADSALNDGGTSNG